jgi:hypothetical protein
MRRSKLLFILFQVTQSSGDLSFEKHKNVMMSSCMIKLEFLPKSYMLFRLGKLSFKYCLQLHKVVSSFVELYERFVMLLKSRSHTHCPHMRYPYTRGRRKNMSSI